MHINADIAPRRMDMVEAVRSCFKKYVQFSGRAPRSEFWNFILFMVLVSILLVVVNSLIFGPEVLAVYPADLNGNPTGKATLHYEYSGGVFTDIFGLAVLVPYLAVTWRRMHDIGKPGYLPFVGFVLIFLGLIVWIASKVGTPALFAAFTGGPAIRLDLQGPAVIFVVLTLGLLALNLFWLTRPSEKAANAYGPAPFGENE